MFLSLEVINLAIYNYMYSQGVPKSVLAVKSKRKIKRASAEMKRGV